MSVEFGPGIGSCPTTTISHEFSLRNGSVEGLHTSLSPNERRSQLPPKLVPLLIIALSNFLFLTGAGTPPPPTPRPTPTPPSCKVPDKGPMCGNIPLPPIAACYKDWTGNGFYCVRQPDGSFLRFDILNDPPGKPKTGVGGKIEEVANDPKLNWVICGGLILVYIVVGTFGLRRK